MNLTVVPCSGVNRNELIAVIFLRRRLLCLRDLSNEMLALAISLFHFVLSRVLNIVALCAAIISKILILNRALTTAVQIKVFWDISTCHSVCSIRRFEGSHCVHLQDKEVPHLCS